MPPSTIGVNVVVTTGARAQVTSVGNDAVTIHPTGELCQPSLHWASLDEARAWVEDLGDKLLTEQLHRLDVRLNLDEARDALHRAGAR